MPGSLPIVHSRPEEPAVQYVITLVHGTRLLFSGRPTWTSENSKFRQRLEGAFAPFGCGIRQYEFPWSGTNSMGARKKATDCLREVMRRRVDEFPTDRHLVVAHSHGGNVALHAICGTDLESRIEGIVCMATPFLHVQRNEGVDFCGELGTIVSWGAALCAWIGLLALGSRGEIPWSSITLLLVGLAVWLMFKVAEEQLGKAADTIVESNRWPRAALQ